MSGLRNVKRKCAELGFQIALNCDYKELRIMLTKVLGILRENGIYSFLVWLEERGAGQKEGNKEMHLARKIYSQCFELLLTEELEFLRKKITSEIAEIPVSSFKRKTKEDQEWDAVVAKMNQIFVLSDLMTPDELFLIGELYEEMLTFSLYKAKAGEKNV